MPSVTMFWNLIGAIWRSLALWLSIFGLPERGILRVYHPRLSSRYKAALAATIKEIVTWFRTTKVFSGASKTGVVDWLKGSDGDVFSRELEVSDQVTWGH